MKNKSFLFNNNEYEYFNHDYNSTGVNERAVEIPIILDILNNAESSDSILEVGNVLSHYINISHDIIDKHEVMDGVINCDICEFETSKKYDLIISISTIEHIGLDEICFDFSSPQNPSKVFKAINKMKSLLSDKGKMVVTFPIGHNNVLDKALKGNMLPFTELYYLMRITSDNTWIETSKEKIIDLKYNAPFNNANGLIIGIL